MSNRIIDLLNMTYIQLKHRLDEVSEYEQSSDLLDVVRRHHDEVQSEIALNRTTDNNKNYLHTDNTLDSYSPTPVETTTAKEVELEAVADNLQSPVQTESEVDLRLLYEEAAKELNELVGMNTLKNEVEIFLAGMVISRKKALAGYKQSRGSMHMVFSGPAGTGKTTVARLMSKLLHGLGYLSKGHCIETDREGLIAGYVGQTATKTKEMFDKAKGGILFIDEAYSLNPNPQGFEQECIDTMVKLMEDNREDLLIIFAGYVDEMEEFLLSNTGLKSRIPYLFHFNVYSEMELLEIAQIMINKKSYTLTDQAIAALKEIISKLAPLSNNSNARMIRNLIERIEREQNFRLYKTNGCDLMKIEGPDILKAYEFISSQL